MAGAKDRESNAVSAALVEGTDAEAFRGLVRGRWFTRTATRVIVDCRTISRSGARLGTRGRGVCPTRSGCVIDREQRGGNNVAEPNWRNRTLFHGDNLEFLREMNSESVHLIATDPPFNENRDFHATPGSLASGASFQDRWSWERDVHQDWVDHLDDDFPKLMEAIEGARYAHSHGMGAYMCFMAVRLLEMKRVLRKDGSIYLHCDPTASHYLKAVMDAIFGWTSFRNEIVWHYQSGGRQKTAVLQEA